jgi:hypothetical protein
MKCYWSFISYRIPCSVGLGTNRPAKLLKLVRASLNGRLGIASRSKLGFPALNHPAILVELVATMLALMWCSSLPHLTTVRVKLRLGCQHCIYSLPGTLTRWHLHPAQWIHKLPDSVSFEEGSLCEPLAVALAGIERSGLRLGDPLVIWFVCSGHVSSEQSSVNQIYSGAGPIGLVTLLSARAAGAEPIVITDLFQSRLDFAKKMVPGVRTVLIKPNTTSQEQAEQIKEAAGMPLTVALECTGVQSSIHTAIYVRCFSLLQNLFIVECTLIHPSSP